MNKKNVFLVILVVFHTAGINEKKNNYKKKKIWYRTWMGYCPSELKAGLGAGCWACWRWARRHGAGGMGARARGARVLGLQARGRAGRTGAGAAGVGAAGAGARWERQAWARGAQASARAEQHGMARGARRQQARGHGMDTQGRPAGAGRGARGGRLGGLCAPGVRSWARLGVFLHLTQFLAWFDSVFFPSHQMNTVHCEIKFFEKKNI